MLINLTPRNARRARNWLEAFGQHVSARIIEESEKDICDSVSFFEQYLKDFDHRVICYHNNELAFAKTIAEYLTANDLLPVVVITKNQEAKKLFPEGTLFIEQKMDLDPEAYIEKYRALIILKNETETRGIYTAASLAGFFERVIIGYDLVNYSWSIQANGWCTTLKNLIKGTNLYNNSGFEILTVESSNVIRKNINLDEAAFRKLLLSFGIFTDLIQTKTDRKFYCDVKGTHADRDIILRFDSIVETLSKNNQLAMQVAAEVGALLSSYKREKMQHLSNIIYATHETNKDLYVFTMNPAETVELFVSFTNPGRYTHVGQDHFKIHWSGHGTNKFVHFSKPIVDVAGIWVDYPIASAMLFNNKDSYYLVVRDSFEDKWFTHLKNENEKTV